jgi:Cytochrome P460
VLPRLCSLALLALVLGACGGNDPAAEGAGAGMTAPTDETSTQDPDTPTSSDGSGSPPSPPPSAGSGGGSAGSTGAQPQAFPGLPEWTAGYRRWTKLNADLLPPRDSDPHLGTKNVFASRPARGGTYPVGTIVVKEGFRPGKDFVGLIATMRKIQGRNPEHDDWVFVEWAREAPSEPFTELASGGVCESCHQGVADQDYVFTRR